MGSRITFFEVEILDWKTKQQLCFLEKVEPNATISDIRLMFHKLYPQWYPSRQSIRLDPKGKSLRDEEALQLLPVGTTATLYFKDLGPQIGWTMNCFYYWGFAAWLAYYINHPLYTPPSYGQKQVNLALIMFLTCEAGNFSIHVALSNLRRDGKRSKTSKIPYPTKNPFTWLFYFVSCPNYTYELGTWIGFTIMTQCVPGKQMKNKVYPKRKGRKCQEKKGVKSWEPKETVTIFIKGRDENFLNLHPCLRQRVIVQPVVPYCQKETWRLVLKLLFTYIRIQGNVENIFPYCVFNAF
ncbi:very-long-chain enoyl-CoA reductase-like isoform X5 [Lacerta agilis]|uniref:very-long-chain enoyl-CoA reductase-like isoform X5 n=1 Tax=Lacerta agilis TaxID=80427 RepID=UPI001419C4C7|nr:very-long-chain enoyl-CoA reductase-like isoform X5 [Lacerta agilis]